MLNLFELLDNFFNTLELDDEENVKEEEKYFFYSDWLICSKISSM